MKPGIKVLIFLGLDSIRMWRSLIRALARMDETFDIVSDPAQADIIILDSADRGKANDGADAYWKIHCGDRTECPIILFPWSFGKDEPLPRGMETYNLERFHEDIAKVVMRVYEEKLEKAA